MANNDAKKILGGAVAGLALGVAASMFLSSKTGKAIKEEAKDMMADFYKYITPKIKKIKKMGEAEYKDLMKNMAQQYGKAKKMSEEKIEEIMKEAQKSWNHFSKNL